MEAYDPIQYSAPLIDMGDTNIAINLKLDYGIYPAWGAVYFQSWTGMTMRKKKIRNHSRTSQKIELKNQYRDDKEKFPLGKQKRVMSLLRAYFHHASKWGRFYLTFRSLSSAIKGNDDPS
ncbi:MAG: hypothetical protein Ct9H90mP13_13230 [Pseudomonadota bacterium]|nr:MAG: hypothetical protein Ct9H90mP13_13230 [Pseudomonadota bacterium]